MSIDRRAVAAVAVGGVAGASVRWLLVETMAEPTGWPWPIFIVNLAGSLLFGWLHGSDRPSSTPHWWLGATTGFCGALTTFSTFAVEVATFLREDRFSLALGYLVVSLAVGFGAFLAGSRLSRSVVQP
ncbi:MAG: CrcB family protein [Acidimicrobiales bacterium]